jgi:3-hydroxybutyrate dehydrogenase
MSGAHVVISGGGTGVGAETARQFAQAGYKVTILGRTEATLKAQGLPYQICDVTDADAVKAAFDGARTEQGPITVVVANAGAATSVPFAKMNAADLTAMTDEPHRRVQRLASGLG